MDLCEGAVCTLGSGCPGPLGFTGLCAVCAPCPGGLEAGGREAGCSLGPGCVGGCPWDAKFSKGSLASLECMVDPGLAMSG